MRFRAILFDAAETLFTTRGTVGDIYAGVASRYGSKASAAVIHASFLRHFQGSGPTSPEHQKSWWKEIVWLVFSEVGMVRDFDRFFDEVYDKFRDSQGWSLFPETMEVLKELKGLGLKLGVISNFDNRAYTVMRSLEILHFFDTVTLSSESGYSKPDSRIFKAAIEALQLPAGDILMVGDNLHDDVEAGAKAGLSGVLVDRRGRHRSGARISTLREIVPLVRAGDASE